MDSPSPSRASDQAPLEAAEATHLAAVSGWLVQLGRTLKTCRLYDSNNPTVVRFRSELSVGLAAMFEQGGPLQLDVGSREFRRNGAMVYQASSRDDNLAAVFHRDGIRTLTFHPEMRAEDVETFLDAILRVTGPQVEEDDLVTLFWDLGIQGLSVTAVPLEGDLDSGGEEQAGTSSPLPWPAKSSGGGSSDATGHSASSPRSDDCLVEERGVEPADLVEELETYANLEVSRFQMERERESKRSLAKGFVAVLEQALAGDVTPDDRLEIASFLPRALRTALAEGEWTSARESLHQLRECAPDWSTEHFFAGLSAASDAISRRAVEKLDHCDDAGIEEFVRLVHEFGPHAATWLIGLLAESQQRRVRRPLARAIAELLREQPERIVPWLADSRWYVVRNIVHILGWIGGDRVAPHLTAASKHPEARVRREVVAALAQVSPRLAHPVLLEMMADAEPMLFMNLLQQLSHAPDPAVANHLVRLMRHDAFRSRTEDERFAIYRAITSQGEIVLPALEEELKRGGLFARGLDAHWRAVARCLARVGTPAALEVLERGTRSHLPGVRAACSQAQLTLGNDRV